MCQALRTMHGMLVCWLMVCWLMCQALCTMHGMLDSALVISYRMSYSERLERRECVGSVQAKARQGLHRHNVETGLSQAIVWVHLYGCICICVGTAAATLRRFRVHYRAC